MRFRIVSPLATLGYGMAIALLVFSARPLHYWDGLNLADPISIYSFFCLTCLGPVSILRLFSPLIAFLLIPVFLVGTLFTFARIGTKDLALPWALVAAVPVAVFVLALRFLALPGFLDGVEQTIIKSVSERQLLAFAREVRRLPANHDDLRYLGLNGISGQLLEKFPAGLHSRYPAAYRRYEDHVFVTYGPRPAQWGIVISDTVRNGKRYAPVTQGRFEYVQIYDAVWIHYNWE